MCIVVSDKQIIQHIFYNSTAKFYNKFWVIFITTFLYRSHVTVKKIGEKKSETWYGNIMVISNILIILNKGNNKITELRAILQRESRNS